MHSQPRRLVRHFFPNCPLYENLSPHMSCISVMCRCISVPYIRSFFFLTSPPHPTRTNYAFRAILPLGLRMHAPQDLSGPQSQSEKTWCPLEVPSLSCMLEAGGAVLLIEHSWTAAWRCWVDWHQSVCGNPEVLWTVSVGTVEDKSEKWSLERKLLEDLHTRHQHQ